MSTLLLALLAVFMLPIAASASHGSGPPSFPLTSDKVKALSACWNGGTGQNTNGALLATSGDQDPATEEAPDRQVNPSDNRAVSGTSESVAIWMNAEPSGGVTFGKQEVLEISSSESVFDGRVVSRSHMIIKGELDQFRHGVEYGLRTDPPDKPALSVDGSKHCFHGPAPSTLTGATNPASDPAGTPAQIPREDPPQPDGFPFDFDPDNNGIFHEHFAPDSSIAAAHHEDGNYYACPHVPGKSKAVLPPLTCVESDGILKTLTENSNVVPGLYYVSGLKGEVDISASGISANVTIVATGKIKVQGQAAAVFTAFTNNLLFMSEAGTPNTEQGVGAISMTGSDAIYEKGHIHAPKGQVKVEGSRNRYFCAIMADTGYFSGQHNYYSNKDCENARLSINKTTPAQTITIGDRAVFDIVVTNTSSIPATTVVIDDNLPTGSGNNLNWEVVADPSFTTDATKCEITGTPLSVLKCGGPGKTFDLAPAASFKVRVRTTTTVAATDCYQRLNNTAKARASNASEVSDSEFIDVNCGAIKINKFRKVPGQTSTQPVKDAGFTLFDGATAVSAQKFTDEDGIVCFDQLQLNKELTVRETTVPTGLAGAADTKATPTANSKCGDGNEKTLNIENLPKTDLTITAKPQIDNATQTIVKCWKPGKNPNTDPPDFQKTLVTGDDTLTILGLLPQILTCRIDIDP